MRFWPPWRRKKFDESDVKDEIAFHVEMRAQLNRQAGLPPAEALVSARRQFGNTTLIGEEVFPNWRHINTFFESLGQDLRYAARGFARSPLFTLTAVLTAAIG